MRKLIFLLLLVTSAAGAQQIYRTVDKEGNVIFTDVPTEGAEEIKLKETTTIQSLEVDPSSLTAPETVKKAPAYAGISIVNPKDDEAIRDNSGNVSVSVEIKPVLMAGHEVVVYVDGTEKMTGAGSAYKLENIDRGTHQLRASVRDPNGRILISSKSTTFHLLRQSVQH